jgi:hypothetical protein
MVTSTGVLIPAMRAQTSAGSTHSVVRVYARKSSGWLSLLSRISQSVSPPVLVQRKRGRNQLRGNSAPGAPPAVPSCGSTTHKLPAWKASGS